MSKTHIYVSTSCMWTYNLIM